MSENPLLKYFRSNRKRLIHKWMHYFDIYHRHFQSYRGKRIVVVEFGVSQGGSLQMWRQYFGKRAKIYGVDIDPRCANLGGRGTKVLIGDQSDRDFLRKVVAETGPIDIVIEDGGHTMQQQIATFEEVYPAVKSDGVFLVEDVHTSYRANYGGVYRDPGTFIEYVKNLVDKVNAWHSQTDALTVDDFTRSTRSIHIYDSIVVFEKGVVEKPHDEKTGKPQFSGPRPATAPAAPAPEHRGRLRSLIGR